MWRGSESVKAVRRSVISVSNFVGGEIDPRYSVVSKADRDARSLAVRRRDKQLR